MRRTSSLIIIIIMSTISHPKQSPSHHPSLPPTYSTTTTHYNRFRKSATPKISSPVNSIQNLGINLRINQSVWIYRSKLSILFFFLLVLFLRPRPKSSEKLFFCSHCQISFFRKSIARLRCIPIMTTKSIDNPLRQMMCFSKGATNSTPTFANLVVQNCCRRWCAFALLFPS